MILLSRHGLTPVRKVPMESMQLNMTERDSTASFTPVSMDGISLDKWMKDDDGPGAGVVYRVKSITQNYGTKTPRVQLEHTITQLGDRLIFGERGPAEITETPGATTCTAKQAIEYVLARQSDWVLGTFDYNNVSGAYKFNGESILECVEKVCNTLQDCWWSYDFSSYPFTLNITQKSNTLGTVLRANRNLAGVQKTVDRSGMVTRFYPIGKNDLHIGGNNYVDKNVDVYGVASRVETDESLDTVEELTAWANEYLDRHAEPIITINVDALELADATGEDLDRLMLGQKCRVMMEEFGEEITETIVSISYNDKVKQPEVAKITLANNRQDATKMIAEAVKQTRRSSRSTAYNNRKVCVGAVVVGNTLTLTFGDGSQVNFNKGGSGTGTISGIACTDGAVGTGQTRTSGTVRVSGTNIDNAPFDKLFSMDKESFRPSGSSIDTAAVYFMLDGVKIGRYADGNLVAGNIKKDVVIMGVTGSYALTNNIDIYRFNRYNNDHPDWEPSSSFNNLPSKTGVDSPLIIKAKDAWYQFAIDVIDSNGSTVRKWYKERIYIEDKDNLIASNIRSGKKICGVTGTYSGGGTPSVSGLSIVSSSSGTSKGTISATSVNNSRGSYLQWTVDGATYQVLIQ